MSWRRSAVIAAHELRLAGREPGMFIQLLAMPILMIAFLKPAFAPALSHLAGHAVNGADQAVPGMVTMFSFFAAGLVGFAIFREHGWHTWDRLRSSQARPLEIMAGKVTPAVLITLLEQLLLFVAGVVLFGLVVPGSLVGLAVVTVVMTLAFVAMGVLLAAWLRSAQQLNTLSSVLAFALAGLGGAFSPLGALPGWAQAIAPITPTYWAMDGYRAVILHPGGLGAVWRPTLVLLAFTVAITIAAASRLRFDETKRYN